MKIYRLWDCSVPMCILYLTWRNVFRSSENEKLEKGWIQIKNVIKIFFFSRT